MATEKQKEVVKNILENPGMTKGNIIREAGYSEAMAKNPKDVLESKGVQELAKPFVDRLQDEIDAALDCMIEARKDAKYGDFRAAVNDFAKMKELLTGGVTERVTYEWDNYEEDEEADT